MPLQRFLLKQVTLEHSDRECLECLIYAETDACNTDLLHDLQHTLLWLTTYLKGDQPKELPPLYWTGSEFSLRTLKCLATIPFGSTLTYQELATLIGNPKASRAVGTALNKNPFPLIIPCHRVVSKKDQIGGFAYPIDLKKRLLGFEKSTLLPL